MLYFINLQISNLSLHIGLPDQMKEEAYLKNMYRMLIVQKANLFDSYRNGINFLQKMEENRLKQPQTADYIIPYAIAKPSFVSYSPSADVVVVPRVLLTEPIFESTYPR